MVLSQYIADTYARELLTLPEGAIGYLLKDRVNRVRDFAGALETIAAGGTVIDPDVVQHLLGADQIHGLAQDADAFALAAFLAERPAGRGAALAARHVTEE